MSDPSPSDAVNRTKQRTSTTSTTTPFGTGQTTVPAAPVEGTWSPGAGMGASVGDVAEPWALFNQWRGESLGGQLYGSGAVVGQDAAGNPLFAGDQITLEGFGSKGSAGDLLSHIGNMSEAEISYLQRRLFQAGFYTATVYGNAKTLRWGLLDAPTVAAIQAAVELAGLNGITDFEQFLENERVRFGEEGTNVEGKDIAGALTARREVNVALEDPDSLKLIAERAGTTLLGRHPTETELNQVMEAVWSEQRAAARTPTAEDAALAEAQQGTGSLLQDLSDLPGGYDPNASQIGTLTPEQGSVAQTIVQVGQQMGLPEEMIVAAISAGIVESNLRNLNHGDRDSLGVFQQRPSQGWGSPAQVRDVRYSARKFFEAMLGTKRSGDLGTWVADTQRPAKQYRDRYGKVMNDAARIYSMVVKNDPGLFSADPGGGWMAADAGGLGVAPDPTQGTSQPGGPAALGGTAGHWPNMVRRPDGTWGLAPPGHKQSDLTGGSGGTVPHDGPGYWGGSLLDDSINDPLYSEQFKVDPDATIEAQLRQMDPTGYATKQIANRAYEFFALIQAGGMASGS